MRQYQLNNRTAYRFKRFARRSYAAFNSMHRIVNIGVIAGCMLTFAHAKESAAQTPVPIPGDSIPETEKELEELVVTPGPAMPDLRQTAKIVTVITGDRIERQPAQSIQDLLEKVAGLDIRQRGSNGVMAGISVRGGTFEQTTLLLNGANLSNPQTAHYSLDLPVNLSDIERIEIIQGPSSLVYGAGTFSGGVNIITKEDSGNTLYLSASSGMHKLLNGEIRGSLKHRSTSHSLSAGYKSSDGYREDSDYRQFNTLWQSHFRSDHAKMAFRFGINDKAYGANTFYSAAYPHQYDETRTLFASLSGEAGGTLKVTPHLYWSRHYDQFHLFRPGTADIPSWYNAPNYHRTDVFGVNLRFRYRWIGGTTSAGGELRNEGIRSSVLGRALNEPDGKYLYSDNRANFSAFIEHSATFNRISISAGALFNYNTEFTGDAAIYPGIQAAWRINEQVKLFASWNRASRTPTFTDLYYKGATHKGNSDVRPENSSSFETGGSYTSPAFSASATVFLMKGSNLIDWVKEKPEDLWESRNLTDIDRTGLEVNLSLHPGKLLPALRESRIEVGYLYLNQKKEAGELISNYVLDYLRHKVTAGVTHPIGKNLSACWQFRWQERQGSYTRYEKGKPAYETPYPSFCLLDLKLNWEQRGFNVYLEANNLLDRSYYDLGNIPQPGIWVTGGISWRFRQSP